MLAEPPGATALFSLPDDADDSETHTTYLTDTPLVEDEDHSEYGYDHGHNSDEHRTEARCLIVALVQVPGKTQIPGRRANRRYRPHHDQTQSHQFGPGALDVD